MTYPYDATYYSAMASVLEWLVSRHDTPEKQRNSRWMEDEQRLQETKDLEAHGDIHVQLPLHRSSTMSICRCDLGPLKRLFAEVGRAAHWPPHLVRDRGYWTHQGGERWPGILGEN